MNILVIGNESSLGECKTKFGSAHSYQVANGHQVAEKFFGSSDVIFDFIIDRHPEQMEVYRDHPKVIAFLKDHIPHLLDEVSDDAVDKALEAMFLNFKNEQNTTGKKNDNSITGI